MKYIYIDIYIYIYTEKQLFSAHLSAQLEFFRGLPAVLTPDLTIFSESLLVSWLGKLH